MGRISIIIYLMLFLMPNMSWAQVSNDDIEGRIVLTLNQPLTSNTVKSTVQWKCLNQDLTRSCVKFHNDQWFEFTPTVEGPFYINVSGQECKDIWGVQVMVFSGIPCEPDTYKLVTCYSDGNKDDIFIRLPALEPGTTYLLNVDGYLHDLCSFRIEFSDQPKGLPVQGDLVNLEAEIELRSVQISWEVPVQIAEEMFEYEIWKRTGDVYEYLTSISHERNAMGESLLEYSFRDSLNTEKADYQVVGISESDRINIGKVTVTVDTQELAKAPENNITIQVEEEPGDPIEIEIWDVDKDELLATYRFTYNPDVNKQVSYNIIRYRDRGTTLFKVVIRNLRTRSFDLQFFER